MTEIKKTRVRTPKQLTAADIMIQLDKLSLSDRVAIFTSLKGSIDDQKKNLQDQIELISTNVK